MSAIPVFTPTWAAVGVLFLVAVGAGVAGAIYLRSVNLTQQAAQTWAEFLIGPGLLQVGSLAGGMLLACLGAVVGPFGETRSSDASLRQWRANPTVQPVFTTNYIDVRQYRYISLLTRATAPADGRAVAVVYGLDEKGNEGIVRRLDIRTGAWSQWQSRNGASRIRIGVDRPDDPNVKIATSVDIALVLDSAAPQQLEDIVAPVPESGTSTATATQ